MRDDISAKEGSQRKKISKIQTMTQGTNLDNRINIVPLS
jgi:hypothetical protein